MGFYDITEFGALPDGSDVSTNAIHQAIQACTKAGGGTVYVPAGKFITGPIQLVSNLTLYLDAGAVLSFIDDFDQFPVVKTRWSGYVCHGFMPLVFAQNAENVTIKGEGVLDGNGQAWWEINGKLRKGEHYESLKTKEIAKANALFTEPADTNLVEWPSQFLRPPLIQFYQVKNASISGITVTNSPFWNTHLVFCQNISVHNVHFLNPSDTPNGDGLDIESCLNVRVSDCHFDVGDDCVVLKSGINEDGRQYNVPTKNVTVTNCTMHHGHGGVVFGSENSGGIENVAISNCVFNGTDRGIRMKTNRERGGFIRNVLVNNVLMEDVLCPFTINSFYRHGVNRSNPELLDAKAIPISEKTPIVEQVRISHVTAKHCRAAAGFLYGLPEMPVKEVSLEHVTIEMTQDYHVPGGEPDMVREVIEMAGEGMFAKYINDLQLHHVRILTRKGPGLVIEESNDIMLEQFALKNKEMGTPVVVSKNTESIHVNGIQRDQLGDDYLKRVESEVTP